MSSPTRRAGAQSSAGSAYSGLGNQVTSVGPTSTGTPGPPSSGTPSSATPSRDLPLELPKVDRTRIAGGVDRFQRALLHLHAICWAIFNTVLIAIWAWGGGHGFWPLLALFPTTLLLLWHARGSRAISRRLGAPPGDGSNGLSKRRLLV